MIILALETSAGRCSAAVLKDGNIISYELLNSTNNQSEYSIQTIDTALSAAKISLSDIDCLAVCLGPGSFTGIRVGIGAIEGIAISLGKQVIGVSSLECLAFGHNEEVTCALAAGRNQYFVQKFSQNKPLNDIAIIDASEMLIYAGQSKIIGNFANQTLPDAKMLALSAYNKLLDKNFKADAVLTPIYIREASIGGK